MTSIFTPSRPSEVEDILRDAVASKRSIEVRGSGTWSDFGAPDRDCAVLDTRALSGVIDYDPAELVLTVGAGTPLAEIEQLVASRGQMLAFEPHDAAPLFGKLTGNATIGGIVAAGVSGSRRLTSGAVRDHLLGLTAVSGRGERFVAGAKVVKNVTGYDLPKVIAGSWGRLAVLTEVTMKVLPAPRAKATFALRGLDDGAAIRALAAAMGSNCEVVAAAHLPGEGLTVMRVEGFPPSIAARLALLEQLQPRGGVLSSEESERVWAAVGNVSPLAHSATLWRASVAPSAGPQLYQRLAPLGAERLYDWAGGLVWLGLPEDAPPVAVRTAVEELGGHVTLIRAPASVRREVSALHPQPPALAALGERVRAAFDPHAILSPSRFGARSAH